MATEQKHLDGMVPDVIPSLNDSAYQGCAAVWGDAATIIPWNLYNIYGDKTILAEQFESILLSGSWAARFTMSAPSTKPTWAFR